MNPLTITPDGKLSGDRRHPLCKTYTYRTTDGADNETSEVPNRPRWAFLAPGGKHHLVESVHVSWNCKYWEGLDLIVVSTTCNQSFHLNNPAAQWGRDGRHRARGSFAPEPLREADTCGRCWWRLIWNRRRDRIMTERALETAGQKIPALPAIWGGSENGNS